MYVATVVAQGLAMGSLPVAAAALARRSFPRAPAGALVVGAAAFVGSQVVHVPLNFGVLALVERGFLPAAPPAAVPLLYGLSAGLCEESARVAALWRRSTPGDAVLTGVGHGGIEAVLLAAVVLVSAVQLTALQSAPTLPPDARAAVDAFSAAPDLTALAGVVERLSAVCAHVAMSVWVGLAVARRAPWAWVVAVALHTLLDALAVAVAPHGLWLTEAAVAGVAVFAVGSAGLAVRAWPVPVLTATASPAPAPPPLQRRALDPRDADSIGE